MHPILLNLLDTDALIAFHRSQFGDARMEGEGDPATGDPTGDPPEEEPKYTQADVDRVIEERLARERKKYADYGDLKKKAAEAMTEQERAVAAARDAAKQETLTEVGTRLVAAEFKAIGAAKGADVAALVDDLNLAKFIGEDGQPDTAAITAAVDRWATAAGGTRKFKGGADQGHRKTPSGEEDELRDAARKIFGTGP